MVVNKKIPLIIKNIIDFFIYSEIVKGLFYI